MCVYTLTQGDERNALIHDGSTAPDELTHWGGEEEEELTSEQN